ncbi:MAG: hypothetical protein ACREE6_09065 [Limisphaerales bacterium]
MNPERRIEKWLKAYAKKRRGLTGESFKLDPAARQMLQSEISRRAPPAREDHESLSLWALMRRHWLMILGFTVCVLIVACFFWPAINRPVSRLIVARHTPGFAGNIRQMPGSIQGPIEGNTPPITNAVMVASTVSSAARSKNLARKSAKTTPEWPAKVFSQNVVGAITNVNLGTLAVAQLPPAAPSYRLIAPAPARGFEAGEGATEPMHGLPGAPPSRGNATIPPAAPSAFAASAPPAVGGNYAMNSRPVLDSMQKQAGREKPRSDFGFVPALRYNFVNPIAPPPPQSGAVLMNFQVSLDRNTIRVVDQDGSVYTGALQPEGYGDYIKSRTSAFLAGVGRKDSTVHAAAAGTLKSESPRMTEFDKLEVSASKENNDALNWYAFPSNLPAAGAGAATPAPMRAPVQKYYFHVQGTNRSLNESVEFAGTLLKDLPKPRGFEQTFDMIINGAVGAAYARQLMNSATTNQSLRIMGTAIINHTNKIQVNAVSAPAKSKLPRD